MAGLVVGALMDAVVGGLIEKLGSFAYKEFASVWGVEEDVDKLSSILSTIQAVLQDAEKKQVADLSIADWLSKLKAAAYDAHDVLDEWLTDAKGHPTGISAAFSCLSQTSFRYKIAKEIRKIITKFHGIAEERSKFHLNSVVVQHQTGFQVDETRETSSLLTEEAVYGRDGDREKIVHFLLANLTSEQAPSILSILGIGGLGKTTLAQLVYNDQRVVDHFDARIWVCVSDNFELKRLIKLIRESLTGNSCNLVNLDAIQQKLQENLRGKKFLLVLDDVWNEDQEKWRQLKSSITCGASGSSIIVTTRLETVTKVVSTLPPHNLSFLPEEACFSLLKRRAFGEGNEESAELAAIGKEIVKKCGGIPLAAKALGGLLFCRREVNEWEQVRDSEIWKLEENGILPSLRLSYDHMQPHLKQCFAFCAVYPKDYEMDKEELVHLWMANGFVQTHGRMESEDCGNKIFNELLRRSFFQEKCKNDVTGKETCKMHDLMHDLASSVSMNECSAVVEYGEVGPFPKGIRHSSVGVLAELRSSNLFASNPSLRTLLIIGGYEVHYSHLVTFQCLRALDISGTSIKVVPSWIGKMKHLRYLNFSGTMITKLPKSICNLRNLQSLKLRDCYRLVELPKKTSKLSSLRHLDIRGCDELVEMPIGMGKLSQLQTLGIFLVGPRNGQKIEELQAMKHLRGELEIKGLEHVTSPEEANLLRLQNISSLGLYWSACYDSELQGRVLNEGLQPHPNLKVLRIHGYRGTIIPSWMASLQNLVEISLMQWFNCEHVPPLGQLPLLKILRVSWMCAVKSIGEDFYGGGGSVVQGFPSLERLEIYFLDGLEEWSLLSSSKENAGQVFPCLKKLSIESCPKLRAIPFLPCVEDLYLSHCNEMILCNLGNNLPGLHNLNIGQFGKMTCLPEGIFRNSTALQSLGIRSCHKLKSVGGEIENLTSLTSLKIEWCKELVCLPEGLLLKLTCLESLELYDCESLKNLMGMGGLNIESTQHSSQYPNSTSNIKTLQIHSCPQLVFSNEDFQHLTSLRSLRLYNLPQLIALPEGIQHLPMLEWLHLFRCKNLKMLPEWVNHNPKIHVWLT